MKILKRLFIFILVVIYVCLSFTLVVPFAYWIITGKDWTKTIHIVIDIVND